MARLLAKIFVELCGANTKKLCISSHRILHLFLLHVHPAPPAAHKPKHTWRDGGGGGGGGERGGRGGGEVALVGITYLAGGSGGFVCGTSSGCQLSTGWAWPDPGSRQSGKGGERNWARGNRPNDPHCPRTPTLLPKGESPEPTRPYRLRYRHVYADTHDEARLGSGGSSSNDCYAVSHVVTHQL